MAFPNRLVVFTLDGCRYGLHLAAVERVVRIVDITPLPKAPAIVSGIVNVQGRVIPVVDVRSRFRLPEREPTLSDQLVIARTSRRPVALVADRVTDVVDVPDQDVAAAETILPGMQYVEGVLKLADGMILIHDLGSFLSLEEAVSLDNAMENA